MGSNNKFEVFGEKLFYACRWLISPLYVGLALSLLALVIKFFQESFLLLTNIFTMEESSMVLVILGLVDISLVGGLLVMVMFSGYENFVSKLDVQEGKHKLDWLGKMDSNQLKNKVASSIVAISSIHLLKIFVDSENIPNDKIMWYLILHITFVVSAFAMGILEKLTKADQNF